MTLGNREKILLLVLLLIAMLFVPIRFILMPAQASYQSNLDALDQLEGKKTAMTTLMMMNKKMDDKIAESEAKAKQISMKFFPTFDTESINMWLYKYTEEAGIRNIDVKLGDRQAISIKNYVDTVPELRLALSDLVDKIQGNPIPAVTAPNAQQQEDPTKFVYINTVVLTSDCYYDNIIYFIDLMYNSGRTLDIRSIEMAPREDGKKGVLTAIITMDFYSVPKFYDDDYIQVEFAKPEGKDKLM